MAQRGCRTRADQVHPPLVTSGHKIAIHARGGSLQMNVNRVMLFYREISGQRRFVVLVGGKSVGGIVTRVQLGLPPV